MAWTGPLLGRSLRVLSPGELDTARGHLYSVYFEEQGWSPAEGNPSGQRVDHATRRMVDDLDEGAIWVGVFDQDGAIVGVARIIDRDRFGVTELERYVDLPTSLSDGLAIVEANRLAVHAAHRSGLVLLLLQLGCAAVAQRLGAQRCFGAVTPHGAAKLVARYGWDLGGVSFRYAPDDPKPVEMIYCDNSLARQLRVLSGALWRLPEMLSRRSAVAQRPQTHDVVV